MDPKEMQRAAAIALGFEELNKLLLRTTCRYDG